MGGDWAEPLRFVANIPPLIAFVYCFLGRQLLLIELNKAKSQQTLAEKLSSVHQFANSYRHIDKQLV